MRFSKAGYLALIFVGIAALAGDARADVIAHTEVLDLSDDSSSPRYLGVFDIGLNTVSGRIDTEKPLLPDYVDTWSATLASGHQIVGLNIYVHNRVGTYNAYYSQPPSGSLGYFGQTSYWTYFTSTLPNPTPSGVWRFETLELSDESGSLDYLWSVRVAAVIPEPVTLALLGLGVAGLALHRRRMGRSR